MSEIKIQATWKNCWYANEIQLWLGGHLWGRVITKPISGLFGFHLNDGEGMTFQPTAYEAISIIKDDANSHVAALHSDLKIDWPDESVIINILDLHRQYYAEQEQKEGSTT